MAKAVHPRGTRYVGDARVAAQSGAGSASHFGAIADYAFSIPQCRILAALDLWYTPFHGMVVHGSRVTKSIKIDCDRIRYGVEGIAAFISVRVIHCRTSFDEKVRPQISVSNQPKNRSERRDSQKARTTNRDWIAFTSTVRFLDHTQN